RARPPHAETELHVLPQGVHGISRMLGLSLRSVVSLSASEQTYPIIGLYSALGDVSCVGTVDRVALAARSGRFGSFVGCPWRQRQPVPGRRRRAPSGRSARWRAAARPSRGKTQRAAPIAPWGLARPTRSAAPGATAT